MYYGFLIIVNIHEIGDHFYIRFQNFNNIINGFESPKIEENEKPFHSKCGNIKGKESDEKLEIAIFGKVLETLTINEALFILNIKNYSKNAKDFKENFQNCNKKEITELIDAPLEELLSKLDIKINELNEDDVLNNPKYPRKEYSRKNYYFSSPRHPINFYYEKNEKIKILELLANNFNFEDFINNCK